MKKGYEVTLTSSPTYLLTSESVTEGHPDKLCDQISDAILDAALQLNPQARVACEVAIGANLVIVMGEIDNYESLDIEVIVRETIRSVGYTHSEYGFDVDKCVVVTNLHGQSGEIADKVGAPGEKAGAGDQGIMVGYACNETNELMPMPILLANDITRRLAEVRKSGQIAGLRPDGKAQVTVEYSGHKPKRIHTVVVSAQHDPGSDVDLEEMQRAIEEHVIREVIETFDRSLLDDNTNFIVNAKGRFVKGGPGADAGLTGRKIIIDTYGGLARHGGGAFSGKDPTKVDRSAAYMMRYVAKNLVKAGLATRLEIQVAYVIGANEPIHVTVDTFGTSTVQDCVLTGLIDTYFDLRPESIIEHLDLRRPIYKETATYGHFGRSHLDRPWEKTDAADMLRAEASIRC